VKRSAGLEHAEPPVVKRVVDAALAESEQAVVQLPEQLLVSVGNGKAIVDVGGSPADGSDAVQPVFAYEVEALGIQEDCGIRLPVGHRPESLEGRLEAERIRGRQAIGKHVVDHRTAFDRDHALGQIVERGGTGTLRNEERVRHAERGNAEGQEIVPLRRVDHADDDVDLTALELLADLVPGPAADLVFDPDRVGHRTDQVDIESCRLAALVHPRVRGVRKVEADHDSLAGDIGARG
jgi:hypothetical protein